MKDWIEHKKKIIKNADNSSGNGEVGELTRSSSKGSNYHSTLPPKGEEKNLHEPKFINFTGDKDMNGKKGHT